MAIDLSSYKNIATALCVRIDAGTEILRFSDYITPLTINEESYVALGQLTNITSTSSELRSSSGSITITISGIPNTMISQVLALKLKGSPVEVYRVVLDAVTNQVLSIAGNPVGRFFGFVNNFSLDEDYAVESKISTNTIALICTSTQEFLENKVTGRKTNPYSMKSFYPSDVSMDRVPSLVGANFNFGAPQ